ncbi:MAG: glycoside hydrolase family 3 [Actinobacteria bacterium 13_2_20CM_2_72_6]|nr:MAG: glycoside hydrolase family 3 [Actinobacteria bacterium 13_2_20CM_2_72_6]
MRRVRRSLVPALVAAALLAGCADAGPAARFSSPPPGVAASPTATPGTLAAALSDEDLVGQVLVPYAYGLDATTVSAGAAAGNQKLAGVDTPAQMIAKYRLGGLMLVNYTTGDGTAKTNPTTNIDTPDQVHKLTAGLQTAAQALPAHLPLLVGIDQEYGWVTRIRSGVTQLPSGMGLGAAADPKLTEQGWAAAGADLATLGVNTDFAPDADVLGAAGNPVIGSRSYGSDPAAVGTQVAAAVRGLHQAGVAATLKHFPGHGHTTADSHENLPVLTQSRAQLESGDLPPFSSGIAAGADLVMSGHLDTRAIDPGTPASFSAKVLVDLLRTKLGFKGVVITDALNMAPAEKWSPGEAAVRAILAGNDMLLQPPSLSAARSGLLDAMKSGQLPRTRLVEAVTRIFALKLRLAAAKPGPMSDVANADRQAAAAKLSAAAVTVLRGPCSGPLAKGPVTVTAAAGRDQQQSWLAAALKAAGLQVGDGGTRIHLVGYGDTSADLAPGAAVTVAMDLPAVLARATSPVRLATYSSTQASMTAVAAVIAGKAPARGRSPIDVPGLPRSACT